MTLVPPVTPRQIEASLNWVDRVIGLFAPFTPETRKLVVNYKSRRSEMHLSIKAPGGLRRRLAQLEIPAYPGFAIEKIMDETFISIDCPWALVEGKWVLDPSRLPAGEKYLVQMSGSLPEAVVGELVRIQPARNKDSTPELDRFWLDSMLRNPEVLELMWQALDIDEVNVGVRVGIEHLFTTSLPSYMREQMKAMQEFTAAGHGRSREQLFNAWRKVHQMDRLAAVPFETVVARAEALTSGELFEEYLKVDAPYSIGYVRRNSQLKGWFPERMDVEAKTLLNLRHPAATGFLSFRKKEYLAKLKENLDPECEPHENGPSSGDSISVEHPM